MLVLVQPRKGGSCCPVPTAASQMFWCGLRCHLVQATVVRAANEPGYAPNFAHDRKLRGAEDECRQQDIAFIPLVAESLSGWHPRVCTKRGQKAGKCTGKTHRSVRWGGNQPHLGEVGGTAPTRELCNIRQSDSSLSSTSNQQTPVISYKQLSYNFSTNISSKPKWYLMIPFCLHYI